MGIKAIFNPANWALVPFHFWSAVFFLYGSMVGSFLNVCIHRMPLGQSIVSPPSHCPHCKYSIPWYLNMPLFTWVFLRGKCANCGAPISVRYFLVELLTGIVFMGCWLKFGHQSVWLALVFCLFLSGLIAASFIDLEHFIIPDEITMGGAVVGLFCSFFVPVLHEDVSPEKGYLVPSPLASLGQGFLGLLVGAGLVYFILRLGKLLFGRQKLKLESKTIVVFTETGLLLPDGEIAYEELLYRSRMPSGWRPAWWNYATGATGMFPCAFRRRNCKSARTCSTPNRFRTWRRPPRKWSCRARPWAGDVKFMAAIGAFLGWPGVVFSLGVSSLIGSVVGVALIALKKHECSRRLPVRALYRAGRGHLGLCRP